MKLRNSVMGLMGWALVSASLSASANPVPMGFQWTGFDGYSVEGAFTCDDSVLGTSDPYIYAYSGTTGIIHGLQELTVSFFDSSHSLLYSVADVAVGVSFYDNLSFTFDPIAHLLVGDIFNQPGVFNFNYGMASVAGDYYVSGEMGVETYIFRMYFDDNLLPVPGLAVETLNQLPNVTVPKVVTEPSSLALFAVGLAGLARRGRKSVP